MSDHSAIEWTEATWNPVTGCTKVSPGCANCYIVRTPPFRIARRQFVRGSTGIQLHPERLEQPLRWQRPRMIFVNSLSDLFHEEIPASFIWQALATMAEAQQHTFQILTKRPEQARLIMDGYYRTFGGDLLSNVWLGVSIENARFTWRADVLREIPAAVRFISAEPLLGSLYEGTPGSPKAPLELGGMDWLIAGGESGPHARSMDPAWARELRDACAATTTAFFFKQWGGRTPKSGGRQLDGRIWDEYPQTVDAAS